MPSKGRDCTRHRAPIKASDLAAPRHPFTSLVRQSPLPSSLVRFTAVVMIAWMCLVIPAEVVMAAEEIVGSLYFVRWRAVFWAEQAHGTACWLPGGNGALRCEIRRNIADEAPEDTTLAPLLRRGGQGWTLTAAGPGTGTLQAWGEPWREANRRMLQFGRVLTLVLVPQQTSLDSLAGLATRSLSRTRVSTPRPRWLAAAPQPGEGETDLRLELTTSPVSTADHEPVAGMVSAPLFRRQLEARGRGRGGPAEILNLHWPRAPDSRGRRWIRITSSRRPGRLEITVPVEIIVTYPKPETFLPLWSLAELLGPGAGGVQGQK